MRQEGKVMTPKCVQRDSGFPQNGVVENRIGGLQQRGFGREERNEGIPKWRLWGGPGFGVPTRRRSRQHSPRNQRL